MSSYPRTDFQNSLASIWAQKNTDSGIFWSISSTEVVLKPYFHSFPEAWSMHDCCSDYGANSGLPKIFGKFPARSLPGNTRVDLRKTSAPPAHLPKHSVGETALVFALLHQCSSGEKSWQLPSALMPCNQLATCKSSFMHWRHRTNRLRIISYTTKDSPKCEYAKSSLIPGLQGHQTSSRGDPCSSVRLCGCRWTTCLQLGELGQGGKDPTHLIVWMSPQHSVWVLMNCSSQNCSPLHGRRTHLSVLSSYYQTL